MKQTKTELDVMHYLYDVIEDAKRRHARGLPWQLPSPYLDLVLTRPQRQGFWDRWERFVLTRRGQT